MQSEHHVALWPSVSEAGLFVASPSSDPRCCFLPLAALSLLPKPEGFSSTPLHFFAIIQIRLSYRENQSMILYVAGLARNIAPK
jgi:hypothetical protein